jgi:integrase/recombinase XerD
MVEGTLNGEKIRKMMGTRNLERAQKLVHEWEVRGSIQELAKVSVADAAERFYADKVAQRLGAASLGKYRLLCDELKQEFRRSVESVGLDELRKYREGWTAGPVTARKKLERLRTFFKFCQESGWIQKNPAKLLAPPKGQGKPVVPFSADDFEKILWATEIYPDKPKGRRAQVRAFVLLLRYSGLRIGDAIALRREKLVEGKLFLRTAKTGTAVYVPLPADVCDALHAVENSNREFFFWSGNGILKSAAADWQRTLAKLLKLAGVRGHAHMFRHTFSISLLENGVPIEHVATLLGHSSSAITARHYNAHVKSRQIALEESILKAWKLN